MRFLPLLLALFICQIGFAQSAIQTIEPRDCRFFNALSAAADKNSDAASGAFGKPFAVSKFGRLNIHFNWASLTGSLDAVIKVQVASTGSVPGSSDWVDKADATYTIASASGSQSISIMNLTESWARVVYTHNSVNGGTINGWCHAKAL